MRYIQFIAIALLCSAIPAYGEEINPPGNGQLTQMVNQLFPTHQTFATGGYYWRGTAPQLVQSGWSCFDKKAYQAAQKAFYTYAVLLANEGQWKEAGEKANAAVKYGANIEPYFLVALRIHGVTVGN